MVNIISLTRKKRQPLEKKYIRRRSKVWIKIRFKLLRFIFNGRQSVALRPNEQSHFHMREMTEINWGAFSSEGIFLART